MEEYEVAYCAGLFEGEGCIQRPTPSSLFIVINMTDLQPLRLFRFLCGVPTNIWGPIERPGCKPVWRLTVTGWDNVVALCCEMGRYLSPRRLDQIVACIERFPRPSAHKGKECSDYTKPTRAGYERHRRLGETPCEHCLSLARPIFRREGRQHRANRRPQEVQAQLPLLPAMQQGPNPWLS